MRNVQTIFPVFRIFCRHFVTVHTPSRVEFLLSFPSPLTQRLRVIFGLLRITPSPLLISLTAYRGLVACEL